ncbi:MAG: hypothetical protein JWP04_2404 [Belnapia sp.]|nr:hypothetical protein [Belnapia sp.]
MAVPGSGRQAGPACRPFPIALVAFYPAGRAGYPDAAESRTLAR